MQRRGARSDFGVSLGPSGELYFGIGHRDFGTHSAKAGLERNGGRPVRDVTVQTDVIPELSDGAWSVARAFEFFKEVFFRVVVDCVSWLEVAI